MAQKFIIYGDLSQRQLTDQNGGAITLPPLYQGDKYTFALRLLDRIGTDQPVLVYPNVRTMQASIGPVQKPASGGFVTLKFGSAGNPTAKIGVTDDAKTIKDIISAVPENLIYGLQEVYSPTESCWMLRFLPDAYSVSGAATTAVNQIYLRNGSEASKPRYLSSDGEFVLVFSGATGSYVIDLTAGNRDDIYYDSGNSDFPIGAAGVGGTSWISGTLATAGATPSSAIASPDIPLQLSSNLLEPESFCRISSFLRDGKRWVEVRMLQAPIVSTDSSDRILVDGPSITRIRAGATDVEGLTTILTSEIQSLTIPDGWGGTFYLKFNGQSTAAFSDQSSIDDYASALNIMFPDGQTRFKVTNPQRTQAYIEMIGPLLGLPQNLLVVVIGNAKPGDLTFELDCNTAEVAAAMRASPTGFQTTFEIELEIAPDGADPDVPGNRFILCQAEVAILPEMQWEGLETIAPIDWLIPRQPKDYIPFTPDQIITGTQYYSASFGDGTAKVFAFTHHLGTKSVIVAIRENHNGGRLLINGTDYTVVEDSDDQTTVTTLAGSAWASNSLAVLVASAGPVSAFQAHTHTIAQIIGLQAILDAIQTAISQLQAILPGAIPTSQQSVGEGLAIQIPDKKKVIPITRLPTGFNINFLDQSPPDLTNLPRIGNLLPAIHTSSVISGLPDVLDPTGNAGNIYHVTAPTLIPGGGGVRSQSVIVDDYVGCDGRTFYKVTKAGTTNSYFPVPFEQELFTLFINDQMLRAASTLSLDLKLGLQTFKSETNVQYVFVIEIGTAPQDVSPSPVEVNLQNVVWGATPALKQRLLVTDIKIVHHFGFQAIRSIDGSAVTANKVLYGTRLAADAAPSSANFAVRARLIEFDTENNVQNTRGLIFTSMTTATGVIA